MCDFVFIHNQPYQPWYSLLFLYIFYCFFLFFSHSTAPSNVMVMCAPSVTLSQLLYNSPSQTHRQRYRHSLQTHMHANANAYVHAHCTLTHALTYSHTHKNHQWHILYAYTVQFLSIKFKLEDFDHLAKMSCSSRWMKQLLIQHMVGRRRWCSSDTDALSSSLIIGIHSVSISTNNLLLSL